MAGPYPCNNVDMVALIPDEYQEETYFNVTARMIKPAWAPKQSSHQPPHVSAQCGQDIWGWTDADGTEYVIQGTKTGT